MRHVKSTNTNNKWSGRTKVSTSDLRKKTFTDLRVFWLIRVCGFKSHPLHQQYPSDNWCGSSLIGKALDCESRTCGFNSRPSSIDIFVPPSINRLRPILGEESAKTKEIPLHL